jgi:hypothetical protein
LCGVTHRSTAADVRMKPAGYTTEPAETGSAANLIVLRHKT